MTQRTAPKNKCREPRSTGNKPSHAGMRDRLHLATLDQADHRGTVGEKEIHLAADQVVERDAAAAIGHMADLDAGLMAEHLERQMLQRAVAGRRHVDATRRRLAEGDDVGDRPSYIGFQIVRAAPQLNANFVKFFRNIFTDENSNWVLPRTDSSLANLQINATLSRQEASVADREFEKERQISDNTTLLFEALNRGDLAKFISDFGDWHAVVAQVDSGSGQWTVTDNTALDRSAWRLSPTNIKKIAGEKKWIVNNLILKYIPSTDPKAPVRFDVGTDDVTCIYIRPVAHADSLTQMKISKPVALQINKGEECESPEQVFRDRD